MAGNAFVFELNAKGNADALLLRASEAAGSLAGRAGQAAACVSELCDGLDAVNEMPLAAQHLCAGEHTGTGGGQSELAGL
ncbi:hypothetical protein [Escherichia coli]|uniref:hypothetical protein n=1 Tax=Escherichia coli TaxID=562 RepID=UPI0010B55074|nr:hypothetical protein [Escherichia coli]EJA1203662.1 hypothetical protein [Escherichia coli]GCL18473.1 hypothetical protein BvCmsE55A_01369 [Escherichia coli]